jgi:hypothetical protein
MISMNISPPRATAARKLESTPNVNARIRNNGRRNIGKRTRVSTMVNATSKASPAPSSISTRGLVQPSA